MKEIKYIDRSTKKIIVETVPGEGWLKWLYYNPIGKLALHTVVKRRFISSWYGRMMDRPGSTKKIASFVDNLNIDMNEAVKAEKDFSCFNDFFMRKLKSSARPVDQDSDIISSPADSKVLAFNSMKSLQPFFVKGSKFNLSDFLCNKELSDKYTGSPLLIFRLAPVDYHRFHFPADGIISSTTRIGNDYFSVSPFAVRTMLEIYWQNKRNYSILKTENAGDILMCEVGAAMVGGIEQSYKPDTLVKKGDEKGLFKFGGSTVILLFEKGKIKIDSDILENTEKGFETTIKMGERFARVV